MIYTTLNAIREHGPCRKGWVKLLAHLGKTQADDEPLALSVILESNGVADALWCLSAVPEESKRWRLLAVRIARRVQHMMKDERSVKALDVAEAHAYGRASDSELADARRGAADAADAADAAYADARKAQSALLLQILDEDLA